LIAADCAISYGSMKYSKGVSRISQINEETAFSCSGEMSDFQEIKKILDDKFESDQIENDGAHFFKPRDYYNFLSRLNYQRRMKMDPLWNGTVIGGVNKKTGELFLGQVDLYGTKIEGNFLLNGLAQHYCQVLMQNAWREDLTEAEARKVIEDGMAVLFYRDKKASDEIQICKITKEGGVEIGEKYRIHTSWKLNFYEKSTNEFWRPMRLMQ
jgi:20S proteasome subunit beta 7